MNYELRVKNILFIDTSNSVEATVILKIDKKEFRKSKKYDRNKAQIVLPIIHQLLEDHGLTIKDIAAIQVHPGPGSFTGLRVGVSIANALGYYLRIPVNGQKIRQLLEPKYT